MFSGTDRTSSPMTISCREVRSECPPSAMRPPIIRSAKAQMQRNKGQSGKNQEQTLCIFQAHSLFVVNRAQAHFATAL